MKVRRPLVMCFILVGAAGAFAATPVASRSSGPADSPMVLAGAPAQGDLAVDPYVGASEITSKARDHCRFCLNDLCQNGQHNCPCPGNQSCGGPNCNGSCTFCHGTFGCVAFAQSE